MCFYSRKKKRVFSNTKAWECKYCFNINRNMDSKCMLCDVKNRQIDIVSYKSIVRFI